jgi:outer membrane protein assembly factor BamB
MKNTFILFSFGFVLSLVLFVSCKKNNPPDIPSTPGGPNTGYGGVAYSFSSSATDPDDDDISFQFDWGDGTRSDWSDFLKNPASITLSKIWSAAGTYSIRVIAKDKKEKSSEWSGDHQIVIYSNNAPNTPSAPNGPDSGYTNIEYTFSTLAIDPDNDSISYQFNWGNNDTTSWSSFVSSGTEIAFSKTCSTGGTFLIRARAKDQRGAISNWSLSHTLVIINATNLPPETPDVPTGPTATYIGRPEIYTTRASDPNNDNICIVWNWGDGGIDTSDFVASNEDVQQSHAWLNPGTFGMKVKALDENGAASNWSSTLLVTVIYNAPPTIDSITGPGLRPYYTLPNYLLRFTTIAHDSMDSVYVRFMYKKKSAVYYTIRSWLGPKLSGSIFRDSMSFSNNDTYYVRAIAKDTKGAFSDTSQPIYEVIVSGPLWKFSTYMPGNPPDTTDYDFASSPALGQNPSGNWRLFIGAHDGCVYGIDVMNGHSVWRGLSVSAQNYEEIYYSSTPAVNQATGCMYIGSEEGELYCFTTTGTMKWRFPDSSYQHLTYDEFGSSAAITATGSRIYVGCDDRRLYALQDNNTQADTIWTFYTGSSIASSPALDASGNIYFGDDSGNVTSLSPSRQIRWRKHLGTDISSSPTLTSDLVYVGTYNRYLFALDINTGNTIWQFIANDAIRSTPVIGTDGAIYFGCNDGKLYALTTAGSLKPGFPIRLSDNAISSTPAIANNGVIVVYVSEDVVYGVSSSGAILWQVLLPGYGKDIKYRIRIKHNKFLTFYPSPTIGPDGTIYCASAYAGVYAVINIPNNPLASTAWPKFRHDIHNTGRTDGSQ